MLITFFPLKSDCCDTEEDFFLNKSEFFWIAIFLFEKRRNLTIFKKQLYLKRQDLSKSSPFTFLVEGHTFIVTMTVYLQGV